MNLGDKPDLLIYHGPSCLDGWGCVWALHQKWPDVPTFEGVYGEPFPAVGDGTRILIADFSYPEEVLREAAAQPGVQIGLLDHHKTAQEHVIRLLQENVIKGTFDLTRSGAAMTWEYVHGTRHVPKLIEHIQDRDLWRFEVEGTREVTAVLSSYGPDFKAWTEVARALEGGRGAPILAEGKAILRQKDRDMETIIRAGARTMVIGGHNVPVCNAPFFWSSEIANALSVQQPFAATYMDLESGVRQFSLRSQRGAADVSEIAKLYGGGGHENAAGFSAELGWEGDEEEAEPEPEQVIAVGGRGGKVTVS